MSDTINTSNIKRNSRDFSFVDSLGSFIQNYEFSRGYDEFKQVSATNKYSYIWEVLSAIGGDYAETIYENVLNYIDNVANVDLCKVKDLQSMITVLGIDYNIINDVQSMPVEIVNMIDILSINKHYLLDNHTFASAFAAELSQYNEGKLFLSAKQDELSDTFDLSSSIYDEQGLFAKVQLSDYTQQDSYLDNDKYKDFLTDLFKQMLDKHVYMQYADAEESLSTEHTYIYEYIAQKLIAKNNLAANVNDTYDEQIKTLKLKYRLENFKQDEIVDDIEDGNDYIEKYNQYEQEVLSAEIERREAVYPDTKTYTQYENQLGYSISRQSYYREKKVKEYFSFIEDTYSALIDSKSNDVESILNGTSTTSIKVYDKDENYFDVDSATSNTLLYYDTYSKQYLIRTTYIASIAEMLAQNVLDIADIRDQIKIQMRKTYLKGTFLLLSYVINEFLKYNIAKNYGNKVYSDENVPLSNFIENCILNDGVELIEYMDDTEYFNISSDTDLSVESELSLKMLNRDDVNPKFYDNSEQKVGLTTNDLPLEEIDNFYRNQLKMQLNEVKTSSDLTTFLSLIYDYGANNTFLADRTEEGLSGEFYCQVWNPSLSTCINEANEELSVGGNEWLGDPDLAIQRKDADLSVADEIIEELNEHIANGYVLQNEPVSAQILRLSTFVFDYHVQKISNDNQTTKDEVLQSITENEDVVVQTSSDMQNLSTQYDELIAQDDYQVYLSNYEEGSIQYEHMSYRISAYLSSVEKETNGIKFENSALTAQISALCADYMALQNRLSTLVNDYVKDEDYWPYYYANTADEITAQTQALASYLSTQLDAITSSLLKHQQNHLDQLLTYKQEVLNMIDVFTEVSALYESYEIQVFGKTGTSHEDGSKTWSYWGSPITRNKGEKDEYVWAYDIYSYTARWNAINPSDSISAKLKEINQRCATEHIAPSESIRYKDTSYYNDNGDKVWKRELEKAYDGVFYTPWADAQSTETEATILAKLEQLVVDFDAVQKMINIELTCLGEDIGTISVTDFNIDNVGDKLEELLSQLIEKITNLDDNYVKLEHFVASDEFIKESNSKITRLQWILKTDESDSPPNSTSEIWNISKINNEFYSIKSRFDAAKEAHKSYLKEYSDPEIGTLLEQFAELTSWMQSHDAECKKTIEDTLKQILKDNDDLYSDFKTFTETLQKALVEKVNDQREYVLKYVNYEF